MSCWLRIGDKVYRSEMGFASYQRFSRTFTLQFWNIFKFNSLTNFKKGAELLLTVHFNSFRSKNFSKMLVFWWLHIGDNVYSSEREFVSHIKLSNSFILKFCDITIPTNFGRVSGTLQTVDPNSLSHRAFISYHWRKFYSFLVKKQFLRNTIIWATKKGEALKLFKTEYEKI